MAWRVAGSLLTLRAQVNGLYPGRSKTADGTIGDAAHQNTASDHNPDAAGVVRALDITHDPAHGCDIDRLSDMIEASRDDRIKYVIANKLIMSGAGGPSPWVWRSYSGSDPHTGHLHLSVVADGRADDTRFWALGSGAQQNVEDDMPYLLRLDSDATVFLVAGPVCYGIDSEATVKDLQTLHAEKTSVLGNDGRVRVVTNRSLIPAILGKVPAGWEDHAAVQGAVVQVQVDEAVIAAVLGTRIDQLMVLLKAQAARLADAYELVE